MLPEPELMSIGWLNPLGFVEGFERLNQKVDFIVGKMLLHLLKHASEISHLI
jgi:hypothetical protein